MTLPPTLEDLDYAVYLETHLESSYINSYVADIDEIDSKTESLSKVKKIFFLLPMQKLSTSHLKIHIIKNHRI